MSSKRVPNKPATTKQIHDTYIQPISSIFPCPNSTEVSSMNLSRALLTLKGSSSQTPPPWRYHVTYIKTSNLHVELKEYATYGMWWMRDHPCRTCPRERQGDDLNTCPSPKPCLPPPVHPYCSPVPQHHHVNILGVKDKHKGQAPTQEWQDVTARCSNYKTKLVAFSQPMRLKSSIQCNKIHLLLHLLYIFFGIKRRKLQLHNIQKVQKQLRIKLQIFIKMSNFRHGRLRL